MSDSHLKPRGAYPELDALLQLRFAARELTLFARRPASSLLAGNKRTRFRGRGMEFEEVRLYQAGDDIRSIDWGVTARTQKPHTKLFGEERERPVFIAVDLRAPMFFGSRQCFKSVLACHIAATLGWAALASADRVGALVFGDNQQRDIRPRRSKHAVLELIEQLLSASRQLTKPYSETPAAKLSEMLTDIRRLAKPGSAVFVISDFHDFDDACEQQLFQLARHSDLTLLRCFDPMEQQLPADTELVVTDGRDKRQLSGRNKALRQAFAASADNHLSKLQSCSRKLNCTLMQLATDSDSIDLLRQVFGAHR